MRFFEKYFGELNTVETTGEANVLCPFPHKQKDGTLHIEEVPSAHINSDKGTFHCKAPNCQSKVIAGPKGGLSEAGFLAALQGVGYGEAVQIIAEMEGNKEQTEQWEIWHEKLKDAVKNYGMAAVDLMSIGLSDEKLVEDLRLGYRSKGIVFPVFIYGEYMGACDYQPEPEGNQRKAILDKGMGQAIFPFDLWREDTRDTFLCAGFKDAAMARLHGLNAITFTHGEGSFPKLYKRMFKDRKVYICYDNDEGGRDGAKSTAMKLKEVGAIPVIVDLSTVCTEDKEDIHDFFYKYEKTKDDLIQLASSFPIYTEEEYEKQRNSEFPIITLQQSTSGKVVGQVISSRVSVVADYSETFRVPDVVEFKYRDDSKVMEHGEVRLFTLNEENLQNILKLVDSNLKDPDIYKNLKVMAGLPPNESCTIKELSWTNVHKAVVVDDAESEVLDENSMDESYSPLEMTVYSYGDDGKMSNGNKYRIFYKAVPHPYKAREVVGIITKIETSDTSISNFRVTKDVLESVKCFQVDEDNDVKAKMMELYERSKAFLGPEANKPVFLATELFYHTPLNFMVDDNRMERAYLEPMIVGESRTHKSATAKGLLQMYGLGTFVSLKNATVPGLIGGSQGTGNGGFKTRLGVIPRNHKGAVILEEFSGAPPGFIKDMTEIRSSNMVRIQRASGTTTAPAKVRMLTISNAKPSIDGNTIPITQYPSGAKVLLDLIGTAEDIARYDYFILKDAGETIDPNTKIEIDSYEKEAYQNRVRWIWSRKPDQVRLTEPIRDFIIDSAKELNRKYETHIQFFGRECWKKLSRVAIATAACVCSYDETGENLVVTEEHVLWAKKFLIACYDNDIFKIRGYVEEERGYTECNKNDIQLLQGIYNRNTALVSYLDKGTVFPQFQMIAVSGEKPDSHNKLMNSLIKGNFIRYVNEKIQPTPKFRTAMKHVNKNGVRLERV